MVRWIVAGISVAAAGLAVAGEVATVGSVKPSVCETQSLVNDTQDFKCPLIATSSAKRYRFKANFVGSHDDTNAAMSATLDGVPLVCEAGSKLQTMGEDGEVSLECKFQIKGKVGSKFVLGVSLAWSHAQYTTADLLAEPM